MTKLFQLWRKDLLLVARSKVWTAFEIILPLFLIVGPVVLILAASEGKGVKDSSFGGNGRHEISIFTDDPVKNPISKCWDRRKIDQGDIDLARKVNGKWVTSTGDDVIESIRKNGCEAWFGKDEKPNPRETKITYWVPIDPTERPQEFDLHRHHFSMLRRGTNGTFLGPYVTRDSLKLSQLPEESASIQLVFLALFPLIYGLCIAMPVISLTRNVLVEKESIKPYLSTIGLPVWLFYLEHWTFGVLKTTILITLTSVLWFTVLPGFPSVVFLAIALYTLNAASFALLCSTIFPTAKRAVEGMVLIWFGAVVFSMLVEGRGVATWFVSLNPNHAFSLFMRAVTSKANKDGMEFGELFSTKDKTMQCGAVYLAYLIFNTIWMLVAAIFMEKLIRFLGHFISNTFWSVLGKKKPTTNTISKSMGGKGTILDTQEDVKARSEATADIELTDLVKIYSNGEKAVNGLSLRANRGEVSILLGHNGCGKSTTFGMITGVHKPTEGQVMIGGIDANKNRGEARKLIGYCPQYNPIYEKLTVWEHLRLVNALKGGSSANFQAEAESLLSQIELTDKKKTLAKNLSGGMKRKLCVCMAMIGGSQVILLDEPTAGMDPAARLDVQKMLALVKQERTILLTTHYMDEAEKLGDWVFVMSHGKMAASGSIHYLKQKYGEGMLLTMVFKNSDQVKKSYEIGFDVCKTICPTAQMKDSRGQMMEVSIPENQKPKLPALLRCLEAISEKSSASHPDLQVLKPALRNSIQQLNLITIGISMSSLEQVFIKIGDECDNIFYKTQGLNKKEEKQKTFSALIQAKQDPPKQGISKFLAVVHALLEKRAYYLYRNVAQIVLQIILPLAVLWLPGCSLNWQFGRGENYVVESFDLSEYPASQVIVQVEDTKEKRIKNYLDTFSNLYVIEADYSLSLEELVKKYSGGLQKLGFVVKYGRGYTEVSFSNLQTDQREKTMAILTNLLSYLVILRANKEVKVTSEAVKIFVDKWDYPFIQSDGNRNIVLYLVICTLVTAGVIIQSIVYLIEERVCKFTHQQLLTGLSSLTYWGVVFLWDFLVYTVIALYTMTFVWAYGLLDGQSYALILLLYVMLLCLAPAVYLLSTLLNSPTKGSFLLYISCIVAYFGFVISLEIFVSDDDKTAKYRTITEYVLRVLNPTVCFIMGAYEIIALAYIPNFVSNRKFKKLWDFEALLNDMIVMMVFGFIYLILLCARSTKSVRRMCFSTCHGRSQPRPRMDYKGLEVCAAVAEEEKLIETMNRQEKVVVIDGLIKDFGRFRAVNGLSISVGHEECFGMLGANGAGKTTTFDIITGLTMPTGGNVTIEGRNITKTIHIGYCPQFDAMLQQISCRQTLRIMARLQGYPNVKHVVETVLECVGMKEHGNKLVKNCSGGQKRKISVGIALISRANCIILDEPTAGIDPRARREIWDIIHEMRAQAKCSIVLTSHSMEECEALCTRIGILRKGEMIALGTSQSLKSQYGNTYTMTLVLHNLKDRESICNQVNSKMPNAVLKTPPSSLTPSLVWELPKGKTDKWSRKYSEVENLAKSLKVKDYMLVQSSLEDTFIRLITAGEDEEVTGQPGSKTNSKSKTKSK